MLISGVEKCSLVDWPGRVAAVVFTPGCNLDCFYCHNRCLLGGAPQLARYDQPGVLAWLRERRGLLDGVVITGGEPTLQPNLEPFIREVRDLGFMVKLDTNGTRPFTVGGLIEAGLLDYVAVDVKAPFEKYADITGVPVDTGPIETTIDLVRSGAADYEFRTTVVPELDVADILAIAARVQGARRYVLQQFRKPSLVRPEDEPRVNAPPHPVEWFVQVTERIRDLVERCELRGVGEPSMAA